jgi:large subunit ribosomal protein L21
MITPAKGAQMYAIVELGGRQWRVEPGATLDVYRLAAAVGAPVSVEQVLLAHDGTQAQVGCPYVPGAKVECEVLEHRLGPKALTYRYRRRENWHIKRGYRQRLTRLLVKDIQCGDK